jgi:hypothetical protein
MNLLDLLKRLEGNLPALNYGIPCSPGVEREKEMQP